MSDFEHFVELRKKFFSKTATPEEEAEYVELYRSGKFATIDKEVHEQLWNSPTAISEEDKKDGEEIHAALLARFEAKSNVRPLQRRAVWFAAAAAVLMFLSVGLWTYQKSTKEDLPLTSQELFVTIQGPAFVKLPDTSKVELKAGSTLTYNRKTFGVDDRRLGLTGTAFFDVTHNEALPFQVFSGKVITTVLGTAFNVSESAGFIEVTVIRGRVSVGDKDAIFHVIKPNEKIVVTTKSMTYATTSVDAASEVAWKDKHLILDKVTMEQAVRSVEERFKVSIDIENDALKNCPVTAYFVNDESLTQVMDVLCKIKGATYVISESHITMQNGEGCK